MQKTENYQLNQWDKTDRIQMEDFNADNTKIDSALATLNQQTAVLQKLKNCQVYWTTYTGVGLYGQVNSVSLTFPGAPKCLLIFGGNTFFFHIVGNSTACVNYGSGTETISCSWSGNTANWWSSSSNVSQMNVNGTVYCVLAFYQTE